MLESVNWEEAFAKSLAGTITGVVMGFLKPHVMAPVVKMLGQNGNFAGPILGFAIGFLLEALAPTILHDYTDVVYGAIIGAFASDPPTPEMMGQNNNTNPAPATTIVNYVPTPAPVQTYTPAPEVNYVSPPPISSLGFIS